MKRKRVALYAVFEGCITPFTWRNVFRSEKNLVHSGALAGHSRAIARFKALTADRLAVVAKKGAAKSGNAVSELPDWARRYDS